MFLSLKLKLVLAFALAVSVTVALTCAGSLVLLREEQVKTERERVGLLVLPTSTEVQQLVSSGASMDSIRTYLGQRATDWSVRFLLLDDKAEVVVDTKDELTGKTFSPGIDRRFRFTESGGHGFLFTRYEDGPQRQMIFAPSFVVRNVTIQVPRQYGLLMSVPESDITQAWHALIPRLGIPAVLALLVSGVIAYLLARSIARPVSRVTRASEAMARGQYDQQIKVEGRDEMGRLARSFNAMAYQVSSSHQMMRDLLANVAHELKTPLTSIQGFSQALIDGAARTPEDQAQAARIINDEAERMRRLVNDLLYLSQLESGQLRMELAEVDVAAMLRNAAERVTWQMRDRGQQLALDIPPDLPPVRGDERRLEQVLANLLDNAVHYTPTGGTITLRGEQDRGNIVLSVHNTGSYIPPEAIERIFERFYRADPARVREGNHGGLGLCIAQEIVSAHHGRIEVQSDPETGTEFRVTLPALVPVSTAPTRHTVRSRRLPVTVRRFM